MSHESRKEKRRNRINRSRSDGVVHSSLADAPRSPSNPRILVDGPISTPPKKSWEQHYKSFLTRRVLGGSPKPSVDDPDKSGKFRLFRGNSHRSVMSRTSSEASTTQDVAGMPDMPHLSGKSSLSTTRNKDEGAVRGGNFFQSVFSRERASSTDNKTNSPRPRRIKSLTDAHDSLDTTLRKGQAQHDSNTSLADSNTSLDATLRKGQDRMYSPDNERFQKDEAVHNGQVSEKQPPQELPSALTRSIHKSREMKKAFTEFHNSQQFALDSSSAYLGDDPSVRRQSSYLAMPKRTSAGAQSASDLSGLMPYRESSSLPTVTEDVVSQKSVRILKPVQGPEAWQSGRRYLIAPAALASCPIQVLSTALKSGDDADGVFGTVHLGEATVKYTNTHSWSACYFLLKQNYLLEYSVNDSTHGMPRGFCHLQYSRTEAHEDFPDALRLEFYASPCARSDKRVLLMRVSSREERDRWVKCLNDAAQLTIEDLYDYDEKTEFGRGRYAVVYPAVRKKTTIDDDNNDEADNRKTTGDYECAIKVIDKNEFWRRVIKGMERADTIVRETSVQATLTTKCGKLSTFLQIRGIFETSDHFVIELELLEGTDLFQYVSTKQVIQEKEAALIIRDILISLDAMARIGLAHRDIKPANVLMCDPTKCGGVSVKVADFGMATFAGVDGNLRGRCGTPGYVAPEIFTAAVHGGYGNKVDVFSAGVTLYVLLCGYEPFYGESDAELIAANKAADVEFLDSDWSELSVEARDLVEKMLERDPKKRINAKNALEHPWIACHLSEPLDREIRTSLTSSDVSEGTACIIN